MQTEKDRTSRLRRRTDANGKRQIKPSAQKNRCSREGKESYMAQMQQNETWTTVIVPEARLGKKDFQELWQYRELIRMFVKRDFVTRYAQTALGPLWYILTAILSSSVLTVVFGRIAGISTDGAPQFLFYMSGNILWSCFSGCVSEVSSTFTSNARLMGKVYFPRLCVPMAAVLSRQIQFLVQFAVFFVCYLWGTWGGAVPVFQLSMLLTPLLMLQVMALALGCGIIIASLTTRYRDLGVLVTFGLQLWMYATPVVYPASQIPGGLQWLMMLNPMAPVVETFRWIWLGTGQVTFLQAGTGLGITILILAVGLVIFQKAQRSFMDTI